MHNNTRYMLVSKERNKYVAIDSKKVGSGRFYTTGSEWLYPQILNFIEQSGANQVLDPFVGRGDLLRHIRELLNGYSFAGYDINPSEYGTYNDSLIDIPTHENSIIVTNPPYLAKHSAKRKRVWDDVSRYFTNGHNDLYQVALDQCLDACKHVVAIIPETFLNSSFPKHLLSHITIAEHDLFTDTDCPACIACFDNVSKPLSKVNVYRDSTLLGTLRDFENSRLRPSKTTPIRFNDPNGTIALRAVDLQDVGKPIAFMPRDEMDYPVEMIKVSSRLITFLSIPSIPVSMHGDVIVAANEVLVSFRERTCDVVLSPFKGNRKDGRRRRRLDYATARAILEQAVECVLSKSSGTGFVSQLLFQEDQT